MCADPRLAIWAQPAWLSTWAAALGRCAYQGKYCWLSSSGKLLYRLHICRTAALHFVEPWSVCLRLLLPCCSNQAPVTFDAKPPSGAFSDSKIAGERQQSHQVARCTPSKGGSCSDEWPPLLIHESCFVLLQTCSSGQPAACGRTRAHALRTRHTICTPSHTLGSTRW
jgi:hypothetical protein